MEERNSTEIIKLKIKELEDKLLDLLILWNEYLNTPLPYFDEEINSILNKIEFLEGLT